MPVAIDPQQYRRILSSYPTGAIVVCAETPDGPAGMTCNSFTSVSIEPPLVAFCPAKTSITWPRIRACGRFCISVLASHHEETSRLFASRGANRFAPTPVLSRGSGPALADAVAWIDCVLETEHDAGDHFIVIAGVRGLEEGSSARPLVFWRGRYGSVASE